MTSRTKFSLSRDRAGLTLHDAARHLGVGERTAYRYENTPGAASQMALNLLDRIAGERRRGTRRAGFRFIDLFAGIGGLRIGFEGIGGQCVFTSEWDKFSRQTYALNYPDDHEISGDIRPFAEDPSRIPRHDVLLGGFPCQPFSIAGVSKKNALGRPHGFLCDTQGTLFFDTARIIRYHRPAAFMPPGSAIACMTGNCRGRRTSCFRGMGPASWCMAVSGMVTTVSFSVC